MICASEAQHDIAATLGIKTTRPVVPTWANHEYACAYIYPTGTIRLSVKQLRDKASTDRYFAETVARRGARQKLEGLGQYASTTDDDAVVVNKDDKVLVVDVQGLPARFGIPADTRANVAESVAATIMGCWTGA